MLHGFSKYGTGAGAGPVGYFLDEQAYDKQLGLWYKRDPLPEVIEGDPQTMIQMIDALPYVHKYTSGVLSFTKADTERLQALEGTHFHEAVYDITLRFKDMLFAGIKEEHRHILIVAQMHLGRLEMHYVTPRCNYEADRAWNPAPPGKKKFEQMDAFVDFVNVKYGLDDPRDPQRARLLNLPDWLPNGEKYTREKLHSIFIQAVIDGVIESRAGLLELSKKAGFEITRVGSNYISMKPPGSEKAFKFKGSIYDAGFTSDTQFKNTTRKSIDRETYLAKPKVAARYKQAVSERRAFVEKRFKKILATVRDEENYKALQPEQPTTLTTVKSLPDFERSTFGNLPRNIYIHNGGNKVTHDKRDGLQPTSSAIAYPSDYLFIPSTPADIGGGGGSMDSGDFEADKIINTKRSEFGSLHNKLRQIEAAKKKDGDSYSLR
ncbi:hypothetical protein PMI36_04689 [Pseudomonas sp. GM79]|uniref:hypothetical protein n=1 Tax=Pseudomonas sp. GM79 TaxID=1144338 RepID=UPI00026F47BA|nr:hypothetical protein [Pseudomonas sp. GM79]EJN19601.1 hypothetical protein PMI36_04689 [Pseudomonas sp. GM79]